MNLPEFSIRKAVTVSMLILIIVVLGAISFIQLGLDLMPDITFPVISVITRYTGVASEDVETLITRPIEEAVSTVKGVKKVTSISQEGLSAVMVELEWETNLDFSAQDIRDKIDFLRDFLPEDISHPMVFKFDPSMIPIIAYGISGKREPLSLRKFAEDTFKDQLEQVDGVASCIIWGGREREILIEVDRKKLEGYKFSLDFIVRKIKTENLNLPGGHIAQNYKEYLLRTVGEFGNLDEIKNLVLTVIDGVPIYLKDVAKVKDTHKEIRDYARTNKKNACLVIVSKESGANTVLVTDRIENEIEKLRRNLPPDIEIHTLFDQARFIKRILKVTSGNAFWGGILAILILYLFLRNWRPTATIGFAIPLSIMATFIPLYSFGYTLNFITLIGIALGVGLIVDNAIVVIENTFRHLGKGKTRIEAAKLGGTEVGMAITTSTLTTICVFIPLVFAKGVAGKIFKGLAVTVTSGLLASLLVALTIVPMIASRIFKMRKEEKYDISFGGKKFSLFQEKYRGVLDWVLNHKKRVILYGLGIFILVICLIPFMKKEFFPKIDNNMAIAMIKMPVGTNLDETDRVVKICEDTVSREKGVKTFGAFVGLSRGGEMDAAFGTGPSGVHEGEIFINLFDKADRKRKSSQIVSSIRSKFPKLDGVKFESMDMGRAMMMGGGMQKPIDIKIFGKDLATLEKISNMIIEYIREIKGIYDVESTLIKGKPEIKMTIDREKASRFGLTAGEIARTVEIAFLGKVAGRIRYKGEEIDLRVRFREKDRENLFDLKDLFIHSQTAGPVKLNEVTKIDFTRGPIKLTRENQKRTVSITANLSGRDLGSVMDDVKRGISKINFPPGYFVEYGGEAKEMKETFTTLGQVFVLAILLIYMIMAAQFESFIHPLVIMFTVPFAIIGVILALIITGKSICLPTGMGILILSGIIVNNGIVFIDYINRLRRKGKEKAVAIVEAGVVRLRPILMTASTTMLGMLPLALSRLEGSAARSVVAISIIGGLMVGTILTLIILPVLYSIFDDLGERLMQRGKRILRIEQ